MKNSSDALRWLVSAGAHPWLVRHHELVLEAAEQLVAQLKFPFDSGHVLLGAAVHDAGKVLHPNEMSAAGHEHEAAGERMLLAAGFAPHIARVCVTHASWSERVRVSKIVWSRSPTNSGRGKRDDALERAIVTELGGGWAVFQEFDALCEEIADSGLARLKRSEV